jgi:predicted Zn-dependent peptidase
MMSLESPASRAAQIARQILLFGRPFSNEELMDRLNALSTERLRDLASRIFKQNVPTIAAIGPVSHVPSQAEIANTLGARLPNAAQ